FNCLLPSNTCAQYGTCNEFNGKCDCPNGFGGEDCLEPLCGSLARGKDRPMRSNKTTCECDDGWTGINCNMCTSDTACNALMPEGDGGICYTGGDVVKNNYQMCDVTNKKIKNLLGERKPQVTFTCGKEEAVCQFQFWVDQTESFYCDLTDCTSKTEFSESTNKTSYACPNIKCSCIPDRMMCGQDGSLDIGEFLDEGVRGPARFQCSQQLGGPRNCEFKEPAMDELIQNLIGDSSIFLSCSSGECLYHTEVPGYEPPVKTINTPLIATVIAAASLFLVIIILGLWYLSRRNLQYGLIRLEESDDETSKLMADHKPIALMFENISYTINGKQILSNIQGISKPGEITAIMGASGAGKTTFLDILARKNKRGTVTGNLLVNGENVDNPNYKQFIGFVDQEDTMLPTLTVHETIMNSALLRLPRSMSQLSKEQRVMEVEKQLGIYHIRDSLIGSEEGKGRGISGGEKRRVGIACELVTSPSILFLDEPTSGLDAYNAFNVVECLVTLAKTYNRTVVFTIHQPRSNIVALFDRLILLAHGQVVYSGSFSKCQSYFDNLGYTCPSGFNIADYVVDLTMHASNTFLNSSELTSESSVDASLDATTNEPSSLCTRKSTAGETLRNTDDQSNDRLLPSCNRKRQNSLRFRQDQELFTRRKTTHNITAETMEIHDSQSPSRRNSNDIDQLDDLPPPSNQLTELESLVRSFRFSTIAQKNIQETANAVAAAQAANGDNALSGNLPYNSVLGNGYPRIGYVSQFVILSQRTWKNLYRNPMLMLTHYAIAILLAVLSGFLFYGITDDIAGFQNRLGLFFFLLALFGFSTLTSLNVFAQERLLFVRERANGYYAPITYFAAKVIFDIVPLRIIPPVMMGSIVYPMTGLIPDLSHFAKFLLILVLFNLAAASICLFIGIICKDHGVANLIGSLVMLFSLLFAGLLLNHDAIPKTALWLQSLSIFHYGFESLIVNEVVEITLIDKKYGINITVPGAAILSSFGFDTTAVWSDITKLGVFAASFVVVAYAAMHILLVEKR
ncbi:FAD-dependent urate hydroxylase, partial [Ceratocystis pirilliformis]